MPLRTERVSAYIWQILILRGTNKMYIARHILCQPQWPSGLSHEESSLSQTLGSWVRIPLKAWISVCVYSVFVLFCVQVAALRRADPPSEESYRLCIGLRNWKSGHRGYSPSLSSGQDGRWAQNQCERRGKENNIVPLSGVETQFAVEKSVV
jgi:hypothetical protein